MRVSFGGRSWYIFPLKFVALNEAGVKIYESRQSQFADYLFAWCQKKRTFEAGYDPGQVRRYQLRRRNGKSNSQPDRR